MSVRECSTCRHWGPPVSDPHKGLCEFPLPAGLPAYVDYEGEETRPEEGAECPCWEAADNAHKD
jgi:hypothetical protein